MGHARRAICMEANDMDVNTAAPILAIILLIFALALFVVGIKDITDWSRAKRRNPSSEDTPSDGK